MEERQEPRGPQGEGQNQGGTALILRVLRVSLHVGFAVLLLVAVVRLVIGPASPVALGAGLVLSLLLAAVYLAGTLLEKRHAADPARSHHDGRRIAPEQGAG